MQIRHSKYNHSIAPYILIVSYIYFYASYNICMGSVLNIQVGDYVEVEFWDHTHEKGSKKDKYGLVLCRARGRVDTIAPDCLILQCWESLLADEEDYKDNQEVFCIATALITQYQEFIPWKKIKLY